MLAIIFIGSPHALHTLTSSGPLLHSAFPVHQLLHQRWQVLPCKHLAASRFLGNDGSVPVPHEIVPGRPRQFVRALGISAASLAMKSSDVRRGRLARPGRTQRVGLSPSRPIPIRCFRGVTDHALICQLQSCLPIALGERYIGGAAFMPLGAGKYAPASCAPACSPPPRHATKNLKPCLAGQCHSHPPPTQKSFDRAAQAVSTLRPACGPIAIRYVIQWPWQLLQRSTLFIVHRQV